MTIKDFGARVESVWQNLRPVTKKMLSGAADAPAKPNRKFSYDAHADWELSRLLSVLDEQTENREIKKDADKLRDIREFSETCARVLESQTESAEVFIQLTKRALQRNDFKKIDRLADILAQRFSAAEVAEIVRQTDLAQIRALAYESLALRRTSSLLKILDDPLYFEIARNALEQQAFEYESDEARAILEQIEFGEMPEIEYTGKLKIKKARFATRLAKRAFLNLGPELKTKKGNLTRMHID